MSEQIEDITSPQQMDRIMVEEGETAVIDFWASWCGPCRQMAPAYEAVAEEYADEPVAFYKVDTESNPQLQEAFNVQSLPTVILVDDGQVMDTLVGAQSQHQLDKRAEWLLSKARGEGMLERWLFG